MTKLKESKVDNGCSRGAKGGEEHDAEAPRKNNEEPKDSKVDNGCSTVAKTGKALMPKAPRKKSG